MTRLTAVSTTDLTSDYETRFAQAVGARHAIAFSYARIGLRAILTAMDVQPGDEVILSTLNCKVVPLVLLSLDLKPVYADISAMTLNLEPASVERALGPATRAILFQHTYGSSCGVEAIAALAQQHNVALIEDCAQCLPTPTTARGPGSWGQAAIFSNNLRKPLPAGSGGLAVSNDTLLAGKVRNLRNQLPHRGATDNILLRAEATVHKCILRPASYWLLFELNRRLGFFYKMRPLRDELIKEVDERAYRVSDHQMVEVLRWLDRLDEFAQHRRDHCAEYASALSTIDGLVIPTVEPQAPLYYFPVLTDRKEAILEIARRRRIELVAWPLKLPIYPVERQAELETYGYRLGSCPVAERVAQTLIGVPTDHMTHARHRRNVIALMRESHHDDD